MFIKAITFASFALIICKPLAAQDSIPVPSGPVPPYAWTAGETLGFRSPAPIDTLFNNYGQRSIPSAQSPAYATTGNLGGAGETLIYFDRPTASDFFFNDAMRAWLPQQPLFYNTYQPMTLLSYNFGGGKETTQDRLRGEFSGNINKRAQIGALIDYLYSKGSYNYQAAKGLAWGFSGSYTGDKFEFQGFWRHYNHLNKENGGITDDLYITDPAEVQGGSTTVDEKTIPTNLTDAHSRLVGGQLWLNSRYNLGSYREIEQGDSMIDKFVPVSSVIWTFDYRQNRHLFRNDNKAENKDFWQNTYMDLDGTADKTSMWSIRNTVGLALLEGFNKYAKAGLTAFATHEFRKFTQTPDLVNRTEELADGLSALPSGIYPASKSMNLAWIGGRLAKTQGSILTYDALVQFGVMGEAAGEVKADGNITTRFNLLGDSIALSAYGSFHNETTPYLLRHYISNHFAWDNDFGKIRRFKIGGKLQSPRTKTALNIGVENVQNLVYFGPDALPRQYGGSVQVFSATLDQNLKAGILHWDNSITYQTTSNADVIPLPELVVYSNLYIQFKVARVLDVQFGVDCNYYTRYRAVSYQPATMAFYNQDEVLCGNYPFCNLYANMKLSKTRFYVMLSHINDGLTGTNSFSMPHYPLNPMRFQLGVSVDFAN